MTFGNFGSFEDMFARLEGLSEDQVKAVHVGLNDAQHIATTVHGMITRVETDLLPKIKNEIAIFEAELVRIKRTVATFENLLATINQKQKEWQR